MSNGKSWVIRDVLERNGFISDRTPKVEVKERGAYFIDKNRCKQYLMDLFPVGSKLVCHNPDKFGDSFEAGKISRYQQFMPVFEYVNSKGVKTEWRLDYHYLYMIWFWLTSTEVRV